MIRHSSLGGNIYVINKYFKLYFKKSLSIYDLNTTEGMILLGMYDTDGSIDKKRFDDIHKHAYGKTQEGLVKRLHFDKGAVARTMKSLEDKGYVYRTQNPDDSRSFIFTLTEKGSGFKDSLIKILKDWNDLLLKDVEDIDLVGKALIKMTENIKYAMKEE